jgi:co-chaperonin GroES (HSP10)
MHSKTPRKIKAVNNNIVLRRKVRTSEGALFYPQEMMNTLWFGYVESVGEKVLNSSITTGFFVAFDSHMAVEFEKGIFVVKEHDLVAVSICGVWKPLGAKVMLMRHNNEQKTAAGIIIPACYQTTDQNLEGVVSAIGVVNMRPYSLNLRVGDMVKILRWDKAIYEITVGSHYNLIVPHYLLDYKREEVEAEVAA